MYSPSSSKLQATASPANILAALQRPNDTSSESNTFSSMLQQSNRSAGRDQVVGAQAANPREQARGEPRTTERQPASAPTTQSSSSRPEPVRGRDGAHSGARSANDSTEPAEQAASGKTDGTRAETPADETAEAGATASDAASTAAGVAVAPASLAELQAILAALAGLQGAPAPGTDAVDPALADGEAVTATEGADATLASIEAAIDKLPKELQAAARALVNLPASGEGSAAEPAEAEATTASVALQAGDDQAKDTKAAATTNAAQVTTVAQVAGASQNQAQQAAVAASNGGELAAASALAQGARSGRAEAQSVQQLPVFTPAGHKAWTEDVGNRLIWMANRGESRAELVLTPPSLGKLGVSIQVSGDQTTAQFVAATPAAREALEQAMPRLREVLQQAGINLGQTDVSTSPEQQAREGQGDGRGGQRRGASDAVGAVDGLERPLSQGFSSGAIGLIDTFA